MGLNILFHHASANIMVKLLVLFENVDGMLAVLVPIKQIPEYWSHELHSPLGGGELKSFVHDRLVSSFNADPAPPVGRYNCLNGEISIRQQ